MAMTTATTTQPAQTEDQVKVLETARTHSDATPKEIAAMLDDGALGPSYVASILDNFHLPEDHDRPESEAARRLDGVSADDGDTITLASPDDVSVDYWKCALCGKADPKPGSIKRHITHSSDDAHEGRGDEWHLLNPVGENTVVLERLMESADYAPVTPDHVDLLWHVYHNAEQGVQEMAAELGIVHGTVLNRLRAVGVEWPETQGEAVPADVWREAIGEVLDAAGIEFDADGCGAPETPDVRSLSKGSTADDTVVGGWYEGDVNNVRNNDLFVTLAESETDDHTDELTGQVDKAQVPDPYVVGDYNRCDEVVVECLPGPDGPKRLNLRLVSDPDGEVVVDRPYVPPEPDDGDDETVRVENETGSYEGPAEGVDGTVTHISEVYGDGTEETQEDDADGGDEPYYDDERIDAYETYWKRVDMVRWLGWKLSRSRASKFDSENSPLAREYNEKMGAKHDSREDCNDLPGNLPAYRRHFEEPAWDYRTEEPRSEGEDPIYLPADFETPDVWDEATFDDIGGDPALEVIEDVQESVHALGEDIAALADRIEEVGDADAPEVDVDLTGLERRLDAIEAAVTDRDTRESGKPFTLHLSADELKLLVKEAPDEVADMALDALAEGAQ